MGFHFSPERVIKATGKISTLYGECVCMHKQAEKSYRIPGILAEDLYSIYNTACSSSSMTDPTPSSGLPGHLHAWGTATHSRNTYTGQTMQWIPHRRETRLFTSCPMTSREALWIMHVPSYIHTNKHLKE